MAFLFCDSFDHYATADFLKKWTTVNGATCTIGAYGRNSTNGLRTETYNDRISKTLTPADNTFIIGMARKPTEAASGQGWFWLGDATVVHLQVAVNVDGTLSVYRGGTPGATLGTLLGTTSAGQTLSQYDYWEFKFTIHNSTGVVAVHKNGASVLSLTGQDTQNAGTAGWTNFQMQANLTGAGDGGADYDDIYVLDGTGSAPHNDFYGDVRVAAHMPNANGTTSNSTPSTGSDRYATVDEAAANGDTDYNTVVAVGDKDTLGLTNLIPTGAVILAFQTVLWAKKTDAGVGTLCPVIRHSGTDYDGTATPLSTAYVAVHVPYETNPGTGAQITEAHFNALEVGYKRTA